MAAIKNNFFQKIYIQSFDTIRNAEACNPPKIIIDVYNKPSHLSLPVILFELEEALEIANRWLRRPDTNPTLLM